MLTIPKYYPNLQVTSHKYLDPSLAIPQVFNHANNPQLQYTHANKQQTASILIPS